MVSWIWALGKGINNSTQVSGFGDWGDEIFFFKAEIKNGVTDFSEEMSDFWV